MQKLKIKKNYIGAKDKNTHVPLPHNYFCEIMVIKI